ncbi:MAG TPA: hypothetical protein VD837_15295 [Terriglobales bacterium]|nr:hypothetical protein [Terriglobales bacterium]
MSHGGDLQSVASGIAAQSIVARLAEFFPDATPVRIPVRVTGGEVGGVGLTETTVIEYGTPNEVLFASSLPLEFADQLTITNTDGSLETDVFVIGVQYHSGRTAVAARFMRPVKNWIVKT